MEKTLLRRQGKRKQVNLDENSSENQRKLARPSTVPEPEVFMEDLPVDALEHVFRYLTVDERKDTSVVCKRWLDVTFWYTFAQEAPLTFDHCIFRDGSEPKLTFANMKAVRIFPCVQIGNVEGKPPYTTYVNEADLVEFYKAMRQIGEGTKHLKLTLNDPPKLVTSCFPNLRKLDLCDLISLTKLNMIPASVQTVHVEQAQAWIPKRLHDRIQSLGHLKELKCTSLDVTDDKRKSNLVNFVKLAEGLDKFVQENAVCKNIKVSPNLISTPQIDFKHVAGLIVNDDFQNYEQLSEFENLKELVFVSGLDCIRFHYPLDMPQVKTLKFKILKTFTRRRFLDEFFDRAQRFQINFCDICLKNLLNSFRNLDALRIDKPISDDQAKNIFKAVPTLRRLTLETARLTDRPFRDAAFKELNFLEKINLKENRYLLRQNPWEEEKFLKTYDVFESWPSTPRLTKLYLHFGIDLKRENHEYINAFKKLIAQAPNVRYFKSGKWFFSDIPSVVYPILEGWPMISGLQLFVNIWKQEYTKIITEFKRLEWLHLRGHPLKDSCYWDIFKKFNTLRYIKIHNNQTNKDKTIYREMYCNRALRDVDSKCQAKLKKIKHWLDELELTDKNDDELNEKQIREKRIEIAYNKLTESRKMMNSTEEEKAQLKEDLKTREWKL